MSHYKVTNDRVALDSGAIRAHNDHSFDGSYIDAKDNRRKKYIGGTVHVFTDAGWVPDVATRVGDSNSSEGAPKGKSIREQYLADCAERSRKSREYSPPKAAGDNSPAPEALTPKQRYLAELDRQGRRA